MTRITRALRLARQSWDLLLLQPTLLVLPAAAALACGVLLAILVLPVVLGSGPMALLTYDAGLGSYVLLAIAAYALTAVTVFFRVALAHCSACLLDGDETSVHHGIEVAAARLPRILLWSLITTDGCPEGLGDGEGDGCTPRSSAIRSWACVVASCAALISCW